MNSKNQAQKGFKTFILTLVISLVVFSAIYYIINSEQGTPPKGGDGVEGTKSLSKAKSSAVGTSTLGDADERDQVVDAEKEGDEVNAFKELVEQEIEDVPQREVLAGSDTADTAALVATGTTGDTTEVAQSTVPATGISGPTLGMVLTLIILGFAAYIMFLGPRNIALYNFEKDVLDDLD